jgi:hypothetical protein
MRGGIVSTDLEIKMFRPGAYTVKIRQVEKLTFDPHT